MISTAAIRFRIGGAMRFLSHAETSRVFQRACVRAGIPVRYSQGFNPHPRLSLPLPRPVGVESEDELLVVKLCEDREAAPFESRAEREAAMKQALAEQLPEGMDVLAVDLVRVERLVPAAIRRVRSARPGGGGGGPGGTTEERDRER